MKLTRERDSSIICFSIRVSSYHWFELLYAVTAEYRWEVRRMCHVTGILQSMLQNDLTPCSVLCVFIQVS